MRVDACLKLVSGEVQPGERIEWDVSGLGYGGPRSWEGTVCGPEKSHYWFVRSGVGTVGHPRGLLDDDGDVHGVDANALDLFDGRHGLNSSL